MVLWDTNISKDPDGIPSYVLRVHVLNVSYWREPALFVRVLKTFSSMESLEMVATTIPPPEKLPSFSEFGSKFTRLNLFAQSCTLATIMTFILSLQNLEDLVTDDVRITPGKPFSTLLEASHRRPLRGLLLQNTSRAFGMALVQYRLTCNSLCLNVDDCSLEQLITVSSQTMTDLSLRGRQLS